MTPTASRGSPTVATPTIRPPHPHGKTLDGECLRDKRRNPPALDTHSMRTPAQRSVLELHVLPIPPIEALTASGARRRWRAYPHRVGCVPAVRGYPPGEIRSTQSARFYVTSVTSSCVEGWKSSQ